MRNSKIVGAGLMFALVFSLSAQARLCKWVGPDGTVRYGEISSANAGGAAAQADKTRVDANCSDASPEVARAKQQEEAKKELEKKRRANTLRSTYSNEKEIDLAFERNSALVNARINANEVQLKSARDTLADLHQYVDDRKRQGKVIPQSAYDDIAAMEERVARLTSERVKVDDELNAMKARCEEDKILYRKISSMPVVPDNKPVIDRSYPYSDNADEYSDTCCIRGGQARKSRRANY